VHSLGASTSLRPKLDQLIIFLMFLQFYYYYFLSRSLGTMSRITLWNFSSSAETPDEATVSVLWAASHAPTRLLTHRELHGPSLFRPPPRHQNLLINFSTESPLFLQS